MEDGGGTAHQLLTQQLGQTAVHDMTAVRGHDRHRHAACHEIASLTSRPPSPRYSLLCFSSATRLGRLLEPLITAVEKSWEAMAPELTCNQRNVTRQLYLYFHVNQIFIIPASDGALPETSDSYSSCCFPVDLDGDFCGRHLHTIIINIRELLSKLSVLKPQGAVLVVAALYLRP